VAAAERGVPAILAEAGGVGQLQETAVGLLMDGVVRVMRHLGMVDALGDATAKHQAPSSKHLATASPSVGGQGSSKSQASKEQVVGTTTSTTVLTAFEWVYSKHAGMWYSRVAAGDVIEKGQKIGTVGSLFGETLETVISPVTGTILFLTINPSVQENGLLMGIGAAQ
jgi:hypothetical protein